MSYAEEFKFVVEAAARRFPLDRVWGGPIKDGRGYAVRVEREGITVTLQCLSTVHINGKAMAYDIREHGPMIQKALGDGFDSMEESLKKLIAKKPKGLFRRIKEAVFA